MWQTWQGGSEGFIKQRGLGTPVDDPEPRTINSEPTTLSILSAWITPTGEILGLLISMPSALDIPVVEDPEPKTNKPKSVTWQVEVDEQWGLGTDVDETPESNSEPPAIVNSLKWLLSRSNLRARRCPCPSTTSRTAIREPFRARAQINSSPVNRPLKTKVMARKSYRHLNMVSHL